jgi:hypothetical protein
MYISKLRPLKVDSTGSPARLRPSTRALKSKKPMPSMHPERMSSQSYIALVRMMMKKGTDV